MEYAEKVHGDSDPSNWYYGRDNVRASVRAAFDAGFARHPDTPEPERLTLGDPRIKPGARVRIVMECVIGGSSYVDTTVAWVKNHIKGVYKPTTGVYLLSEAPNPDAELLEVLMRADSFREELPVYVSRLALMREAGLKVELAT